MLGYMDWTLRKFIFDMFLTTVSVYSSPIILHEFLYPKFPNSGSQISPNSKIPNSGKSEVGGLSSTGKWFRVVRTCVRAVCMSSEFGAKISGLPLSLFPFGLGRFSLFPSPAPQSPIQLQLALPVSYIMTTDQSSPLASLETVWGQTALVDAISSLMSSAIAYRVGI